MNLPYCQNPCAAYGIPSHAETTPFYDSRVHVLVFSSKSKDSHPSCQIEWLPSVCEMSRNILSASKCSCFLDKGGAFIVSLSHSRSFTKQPLLVCGLLRFSENKVLCCADKFCLVDPRL